MPKIIEDVKENLLNETRRQILEYGYSKVTIRSIASALGLGVGTIYNYYKSKDMIVAAFMLEDWMKCLDEIKALIKTEDDHIKIIYYKLQNFINEHNKLFADESAEKNYALTSSKWHKVLRKQIAEIVIDEIDDGINDKMLLAEFVSEAIISWCLENKKYSELSPIFTVLLKNKGEENNEQFRKFTHCG